MLNPQKILVIGYVWPEVQSSAAGLRDWNLISAFLEAGWEVVYASPSQENLFSQKLHNLGIKTFTVQANDSNFDIWVKDLAPDFVIFDRFVIEEQFGWRVKDACPSAIRVLDTQDLHFLRRARKKGLDEGQSLAEILNIATTEISSELTQDALRELAAIYRSDLTLIISRYELHLLTEQFQIPQALLSLMRFHYPPPPEPTPFEERAHFMMIGNFRHPPNADAILWFKREIWPYIRKGLPDAQVHIYGAYPPKEMMNLTDPAQGFKVMGPAVDQFVTLQKYRVNLAPLRFGAGIKGKISDGWWSGTPVVSTPIGFEGMSDELPWGGEVATSPEEFAQKAIDLYQNKSRWSELQNNGLRLILELYSQKKNAQQLIETFSTLKKSIAEQRKSNLIGQILNHHLHQSTKYFSRWIEAKNKT